MVNLDLGLKLDDLLHDLNRLIKMYSQKYIFQIALKCERRKKIGSGALFSGTGGDDHQFFFFVA
jgi:hypothetical protein